MAESDRTVNKEEFDAVIFDLDGVVTRTATLHARAWKRVFDEYLEGRAGAGAGPFRSFEIETDYAEYVDGMPRYAGVRSFLASRDIQLPDGKIDDAPDRETVCGLGNRKNELYNEMLDAGGAEIFDDAVECLHAWREIGLKTAIVSSSKNCAAVLRSTGLAELFCVRVDGVEAERFGLSGKPDPDIFLKAAELLGVDPARSVVLEDAVSGVQAARAGGFGWVVGVDRGGAREALLANGADTVATDLRELR